MANTMQSANQPYYETIDHLRKLPKHLKQFIVDQLHDEYTPIDHAVWRYIMRRNIYYLKKYAHRLYFQGLLDTGISFDAIPHIEEMNAILAKIGWGGVAVDGFIPPAAFMEYQAYRVLVIAVDMRQINHIEYTPAPDIVHEAAGHAPIIVDSEYADYLQRFGEVGAKAMSSKKDFELYEAIRHLSILKERPRVDSEEVAAAEKDVEYKQANLGKPSEMARLSRLHWWTVEYGLIGTLENPKIYGAGLLSSIGEAVHCLEPHVKKIPYDIGAAEYPFDITTMQPQLFVTPDFDHLMHVLEEFADSMAYKRGGMYGMQRARECENVSSAELSSGIQVSGVFTDVIDGGDGQPVYIKTTGPSALAYDYKQMDGHDKNYHRDGFGSPVGRFKGHDGPPERLDDAQLKDLGAEVGRESTLEFQSGVSVTGRLERIERREGKIILMVFSDCRVSLGDKVLFDPSWGPYDMAVGESVVSVFNGAADKDAYQAIALVPKERTIKYVVTDDDRKLHRLYQQIRDIRERKDGYDRLSQIFDELTSDHSSDWLASWEIFDMLENLDIMPELKARAKAHLDHLASQSKELKGLIEWGYTLVDYQIPAAG